MTIYFMCDVWFYLLKGTTSHEKVNSFLQGGRPINATFFLHHSVYIVTFSVSSSNRFSLTKLQKEKYISNMGFWVFQWYLKNN